MISRLLRGFAVLVVAAAVLSGCLPQLASRNPLTVSMVGEDMAVVSFHEPAGAYNVELHIGRGYKVLESNPALSCVPIENVGLSCFQDPPGILTKFFELHILAEDPSDVSATVWYSVQDGLDRLARAVVEPSK